MHRLVNFQKVDFYQAEYILGIEMVKSILMDQILNICMFNSFFGFVNSHSKVERVQFTRVTVLKCVDANLLSFPSLSNASLFSSLISKYEMSRNILRWF